MDTQVPTGGAGVAVVTVDERFSDWFGDDATPPTADALADRVAAECPDDVVGAVRVVAPDDLPGDASLVVAPGMAALLAAVRAGVDAPVLPVAAGRGVRSVPAGAVVEAVETALAAEPTTVEYPVYAVAVGDADPVRTLLDVLLVTTEPARISEYAVQSVRPRQADGDLVDAFRADGVVVSTPAGSTGYGRANDGPVLAPESGSLSVVPVASFRTDPDHWVLAGDGVTVSVERDEGPVSVYADGREIGRTDPSTPVRVRPDGHVDLVVVPSSRSFFGAD